VEKKDEIIQEDFSVDLTSLVIYDIYPGEEDPLKEVSPSIDTLQFVERHVYRAASTPSPKTKQKTKFALKTNPHCYTYFYISLFEFIIPAPIRVYR
jgi:hypothetical protein